MYSLFILYDNWLHEVVPIQSGVPFAKFINI